jgi:hypothetical protein
MFDNTSNQKIPVFVSSTYIDLIPYRDEVSMLLNSMGCDVHGMENFGSRTESPLQTCLNEVRLCKIFIGVLGMKYGSIDKSNDKSLIEVEYEAARENSLEILFYVINEDKALVHPKFVDICSVKDNKGARLKEFKDLIKDRHTVSFFESEMDLRIKVERDVKRLLLSRNLRGEPKHKYLGDGGVTIVAAGNQSYYLGEKIRLSGTTLAKSGNIFLFLTGPHLNPFGVKLDNIPINAISDNSGTFTVVNIAEDNSWSYEWDTSKITDIRESGNFLIYAVAEPKNKNDLLSGEYATVSVILKNPFIAAALSKSYVANGDELILSGVAEGSPNNVFLWVFGKNYRLMQNPINVGKDSSFKFIFSRKLTKILVPGQYFVVLQHPMQNGRPDIVTSSPGTDSKFFWKDAKKVGEGINAIDISQMRPSDAAEKLIELLNLPDVDDSYTKMVFMVEEPVINLDPIQPKHIGEFFTITGSTNLNVDDELLVEIKLRSIPSENNQQNDKLPGFSAVCRVIKGGVDNKWSVDIDGGTFVAGEYTLKVTSFETEQLSTGIFEIKEKSSNL